MKQPVSPLDLEGPAAAKQVPLRVGVLLDGYSQPAWIASVLQDIQRSQAADIALVVLNASEDQAASQPRRSLTRRVLNLWRARAGLPYTAYRRLDRRRYLQQGDPEQIHDAASLLADVPVIRVTPRKTKHCDYFDDAAVAEIGRFDLDVVLRFGFRILKGEALRIARYGVWSFHHGDNRHNRGGPAGFWEVMRQQPVTGAVLQVLSEDLDAGLVLARSFSSTEPISVTANKHNYYWQAAHLLHTTLRDLHARRDALLSDTRAGAEWTAYSQPLFVAPGASEMVRMAVRLGWRLLVRKAGDLMAREQWFLAYRLAKASPDGGNTPDGAPFRFKELIPPVDRFWADPIPVYADGKHYIFFEEYFFGSPRAHICVIEIDRSGTAGEARRVLERPYHLSYPFVFTWKGDWYMVPETVEHKTVELYRAIRFPDQWEFERTLLSDIAAMDATLAEIDGIWWMFTGVMVPGTKEASLLNIYRASSPLGPWVPHPQNPVKVDVRSARPAGPLFEQNGKWYRPSQCGAPTYGSAIVMNRILELTPTRFQEVEGSRLTPTWRPGLNGTHTIGAAHGLTVIDARRRVCRCF